ncbi:MAG: alpha-glucuronidase family glycosyl hydrolase [Lysobacterales bacterium]
MIRRLLFLLAALSLAGLAPAGPCLAEDGYQLWLRYPPLPAQQRERAQDRFGSILVPASRSTSAQAALDELQRGLAGLLAQPLPLTDQPRDGAILLGTPDTLPLISQLDLPLGRIGPEGYIIRSVEIGGHATTVIAANGDTALLYGVFALLRLLQTDASLDSLDTLDVLAGPAVQLRVLNHWDNLDRSVERGYAGQSIWDWWRLPDFRDPRYTDYARANASIGINGTVLNNVNAQAEVLTAPYLAKAAALADVFRPYGIRVYLAVRFSSPVDIGGLTTADPLDPAVRAWWRGKAAEIYTLIPDFGGFLVKANSEGQPGPQNYGRSHADGANLLAEALRPHGGNVMWRAFVYSQDDPEDRVRQAYTEFKPLDGTFSDNVLVQVKNGALDFQPREPFHPLFGAMPATPLMLEFQITQEYLGFSTHLVYLGALYEEVLTADTFAAGAGSTVARVIDGSLHGYARTGMAGVANIGSDRDWSGSSFAQANWYAFGRLAWDPRGSARAIAEEWLRMTFSPDPRFVQPAAELMMRSHQAAVDYMTPLGLAHLMGTGHHYGPAPWVDDLERPEWNPYYYHRADAQGIGLDRTARGSDAVAQYAPPVAGRFADLQSVPDDFLLWFHRLPWDHKVRSGATLWEELIARYDRGIAEVETMRDAWAGLQPFVDAERFAKTRDFLDIQLREARWWRDACLAYFMHLSGRELPPGTRPPAESLEYYRSLEFPNPPGW